MLAAKNLIKKKQHANSHHAFVAPTKIGLLLWQYGVLAHVLCS